MNDAIPLLEMRNVHKSFGETRALKGITIRLNPGRVYGLVGENGAGKSTLVKSMCGAVRPDSGEIIVDGEVVTLESPRHAREVTKPVATPSLTAWFPQDLWPTGGAKNGRPTSASKPCSA